MIDQPMSESHLPSLHRLSIIGARMFSGIVLLQRIIFTSESVSVTERATIYQLSISSWHFREIHTDLVYHRHQIGHNVPCWYVADGRAADIHVSRRYQRHNCKKSNKAHKSDRRRSAPRVVLTPCPIIIPAGTTAAYNTKGKR